MLFKSVDPVSPKYSSINVLINAALSQSMFQWLDYLTKQFSIFTGVILFVEALLFFFIFILYWSMVDLQHCISFRCMAKWFSYIYTYICTNFFKFFFHAGAIFLSLPGSCSLQPLEYAKFLSPWKKLSDSLEQNKIIIPRPHSDLGML